MSAALAVVALAAIGQTTTSTAIFVETRTLDSTGEVTVRVTSGTEWDTNAGRVVGNQPAVIDGMQSRVAGDGLVRVTSDLGARAAAGSRLSLRLGYQIGAKRFFSEQSQDLVTHQFRGQGWWFPASLVSVGLGGLFRVSRIRDGTRDYNLGQGTAQLRLHPSRLVSIGVGGAFTGFRFVPDPRFQYRGPSVWTDIVLSLDRRFRAYANGGHAWRQYEVDLSGSGERDDTELSLAVGGRYTGPFELGAGYRLRRQRSTNDAENIDRHRLTADAAFALAPGWTALLVGALQINSGTSQLDLNNLQEDNESRNSLQVGLRYALDDQLSLDARYALYTNQFSTANVSYERQTVYLGVSYRAETIPL